MSGEDGMPSRWFTPSTLTYQVEYPAGTTPVERAQLVAMDAIEGEASWEAVAKELAEALDAVGRGILDPEGWRYAKAERALNAYAKRAAT